MQDAWYSDDRDIVKWGTIAHIAKRERIERIVQVAFLRRSERHVLETPTGARQIEPEVWQFFRDVSGVQSLGQKLGLEITVIVEPFEKRRAYRERVASEIQQISRRKLVLLDPDTGIAAKTSTLKHLSLADVDTFWNALKGGDWLVLYQHAPHKKDWLEPARQQLAAMCRCDGAAVEAFTAPKIAWDVAFLAVQKKSPRT